MTIILLWFAVQIDKIWLDKSWVEYRVIMGTVFWLAGTIGILYDIAIIRRLFQ